MGIFFPDQRHFHNCFHGCTSVCIFTGARKSVVNQPTILVGPLVKVPNCRHARCARLTKFLQVLLAQYFRSLAIRTRPIANDASMFAICSPTAARVSRISECNRLWVLKKGCPEGLFVGCRSHLQFSSRPPSSRRPEPLIGYRKVYSSRREAAVVMSTPFCNRYQMGDSRPLDHRAPGWQTRNRN
jgi:hypothetical protein